MTDFQDSPIGSAVRWKAAELSKDDEKIVREEILGLNQSFEFDRTARPQPIPNILYSNLTKTLARLVDNKIKQKLKAALQEYHKSVNNGKALSPAANRSMSRAKNRTRSSRS